MTTVRDRVTALDTAISELTDRAARAAEHLARLDAQIEKSTARLARGTLDGALELSATEETKPAAPRARARRETTAPAPPPSPDAQLEHALRTKPAGLPELARTLDLPVGRVSAMVARLRKADRITNLGTEERPSWTWRVGDETSTEELYASIETMIRFRPMTHGELVEATGARGNRVSGGLVDLQRKGLPVTNLGTERRARWFCAARPL